MRLLHTIDLSRRRRHITNGQFGMSFDDGLGPSSPSSSTIDSSINNFIADPDVNLQDTNGNLQALSIAIGHKNEKLINGLFATAGRLFNSAAHRDSHFITTVVNNPSASWSTLFCMLYSVIITIGVVTNVYVIYRMYCFQNRDREQYRNGIGICLCVMAISHLVALTSLLINLLLFHVCDAFSDSLYRVLCKFLLFFTHTAYTQSMWCWLFMSGLRYLATTRPLQYTTLWRLPFTAMSTVLVGAIVENSWLLFALNVSDRNVRTQTSDLLNRVHRLFDICVSFVIPAVLVLYMDVIVLCRRKKPNQSDPMLQFVINRPNMESKRMFYRFLIVTVTILLLNVPENFQLFLKTFDISSNSSYPTKDFVSEICRLLFFSQFSFNAFYLTMHVYDKSVLSKTNSSRQLSISIRQRLEESSHMLRERSSTVSYRAATPMPPLARNSSCCALDELYPLKHWL